MNFISIAKIFMDYTITIYKNITENLSYFFVMFLNKNVLIEFFDFNFSNTILW